MASFNKMKVSPKDRESLKIELNALNSDIATLSGMCFSAMAIVVSIIAISTTIFYFTAEKGLGLVIEFLALILSIIIFTYPTKKIREAQKTRKRIMKKLEIDKTMKKYKIS